MKTYSEKVGPVQYFSGIAFACLALPYAGGIPSAWPVCLPLSIAALWFFVRVVKKEEAVLRTAKRGDPIIGKVLMLFIILTFANAVLVRFDP